MAKRKRATRQQREYDDDYYSQPFSITAKNAKQAELMDAIRTKPITIAIGCAGTGKTYCSTGTIASLFSTKEYRRIVLSRTNVPTGPSLGHFPGDVKEKMSHLLRPMLDVLKAALGSGYYNYLINKDIIEMQPFEHIRGRSFENTLVLVDEVQNMSMDELKAITTRLGEGSRLVLMGDPAQSDVQNGKNLDKFCMLAQRNGIDIPIIKFGVDDIVRSDITADLVRMFIKEKI